MPTSLRNKSNKLLDILRHLQKRHPRIYVDPDCRQALRRLFTVIKNDHKFAERKQLAKSSSVKIPARKIPQKQTSQGKNFTRGRGSVDLLSVCADIAANLPISGKNKTEKLASLTEIIANDQVAKNVGNLRERLVNSIGSQDSKLVLVGEAPGYEEEIHGEPFVGKAGRLLGKILTAMNLEREKLYIANIVKYRPALPGQKTNNRKPSLEEMAAFLPFFLAELAIIKPRIVIALGGSAGEALLTTNAPVGTMRAKLHKINHKLPELKNTDLIVTYHPSYLLRSQSLTDRGKVWQDMLLAMQTLNLPITEKQKNYFNK